MSQAVWEAEISRTPLIAAVSNVDLSEPTSRMSVDACRDEEQVQVSRD